MTIVAMLIVAAIASMWVADADARPAWKPQQGKVLLGTNNPDEFKQLTGKDHPIRYIAAPWRYDWPRALGNLDSDERAVIHLNPPGTSKQIALGARDGGLIALSRQLNESGKIVYVRIWPEMNGVWHRYCGFFRNGKRKGPGYSVWNYRRAFRRMSIILDAGGRARVNTRLRHAGLPKLKGSGQLPRSRKVAIVYNPQGEGAPNVAGNQPWSYYPGNQYVHIIANDLFGWGPNGRAKWAGMDHIYNHWRKKSFMVAEWGLAGHDVPTFAKRMFRWVRNHPRMMALVWLNGNDRSDHGLRFALQSKPRTLSVYRNSVQVARFR